MVSDLSVLQIQLATDIGPQRARLFSRLGIATIQDALYYLPWRYEDRSRIKKIAEVRPGEAETVRGRVISAEAIRLRGKRLQVFDLVINDGTGLLSAKWFNQPFMKKNIAVGHEVLLYGVVKAAAYRACRLSIDNPEYEILAEDDDALVHINRIVPIYRVTEGISQKQFRKIMYGIVRDYAKDILEVLPAAVINRNSLPPLKDCISRLHFPDDNATIAQLQRGISAYHRRIVFDEFFMLGLGLAVLKKNMLRTQGIAFRSESMLTKRLAAMLPFELTDAQKRVVGEIISDMQRPAPMNRLLQGDVGCGKTVVALFAMLNAVECGYQAALMAPTELLAEQHYNTIQSIVQRLGLKSLLLTGSSRAKNLDKIAEGKIDIIVGTHALIEEGVQFSNLGLAVIDEQHKFGVMQRALLKKKGIEPDMLVMTATPIPRSLALTIYGDLECSIIDELPPGRKPVITKIYNSAQKDEIYRSLAEELEKRKQAYIVYPSIEDSEKSTLKSAVQGKKGFQAKFPEYRVELLHGRMNADERGSIMTSFKNREIDILVSTTVIEVGMDLPEATLMIIIHAERFGLAQLHQLRGRVGRGADISRCILVAYEPYGEDAGQRLKALAGSNDGFRIAEEDLEIRGPGDFFGTKQSGVPDLRFADLARDREILEVARKEAFHLIDNDPLLKDFPSLRKALEVFWKGKADLYKTG